MLGQVAQHGFICELFMRLSLAPAKAVLHCAHPATAGFKPASIRLSR